MIGELVKYGAIGLSVTLAGYACTLIKAEQQRPTARKSILRATYAYMGFALLLATIGFAAEVFVRHDRDERLNNYVTILTAIDRLMDAKAKVELNRPDTRPEVRIIMTRVIRELDRAAQEKLIAR